MKSIIDIKRWVLIINFVIIIITSSVSAYTFSGSLLNDSNVTHINSTAMDTTSIKAGIFDEYFEDGILTNWDFLNNAGISLNTTTVRNGTYSIRSNSTSANTVRSRMSIGNITENFSVYFSLYASGFNESADYRCVLLEDSGTDSIFICLVSEGTTLYVKYLNDSSQFTTMSSVSRNTWYDFRLDVYPHFETSDSSWNLFMNGSSIKTYGTTIGGINTYQNFTLTQAFAEANDEMFVDNIRISWLNNYQGNTTFYHPADSGNETYKIYLNLSTPTGTNYTVWENSTGSFVQNGGTYTGNQTITTTASGFRILTQNNLFSTPEINSVETIERVVVLEKIPPTPSCLSITIFATQINISCTSGEGNVTTGMNFTNINTNEWFNTSVFYNLFIGLTKGTEYVFRIFSFNSSGNGTLNNSYYEVTATTYENPNITLKWNNVTNDNSDNITIIAGQSIEFGFTSDQMGATYWSIDS